MIKNTKIKLNKLNWSEAKVLAEIEKGTLTKLDYEMLKRSKEKVKTVVQSELDTFFT